MQIARVVGTVVSTQKNRKLEGAKLLLVQPLSLEGTARGVALLAIDAVGAGVGERVLVVIEGKAAGDALGRKAAAVDAAIIGIIDSVDITETESGKGPLTSGAERSEALAGGGGAPFAEAPAGLAEAQRRRGAPPQTKK